MKISCLAENTCCFSDYEKENGLSILISTEAENILFDFGAKDIFLKNAKKLGFDLKEVSKSFISHGHYDHGLGVTHFLEANPDCPVYIQQTAFGDYFANFGDKPKYGGLDKSLINSPRFVRLDGTTMLNEYLHVIANVPPKKEEKTLLMKKDDQFLPDTFEHEQSLVLSENGKNVLISGCSHCGIDNILTKAKETCGKIDVLVGGFHLMSYDYENEADLAEIDTLGYKLLSENVMCYTCHCTTIKGYSRLKLVMGDNLGYLSTGNTIAI